MDIKLDYDLMPDFFVEHHLTFITRENREQCNAEFKVLQPTNPFISIRV